MAAGENVPVTTTTTGAQNLDLGKQPKHNITDVMISGTYGSLTFTWQGSLDGTNFFNIYSIDKSSGGTIAGGSAISPSDNTTIAYRLDSSQLSCIRMNISALSTVTSLVLTPFNSTIVGAPIIYNNQAVGSFASGALTITSNSATALAVGPNGTTNPTLKVVGNVSSEAGGLSVTGGADAVGVALAALGSNTNEPLLLDAKGSGLISIATSSTGGTVVRSKIATVAVGGTAIANANAVDEGFYYVTGADNTAAVKLPASVAGKTVRVKNSVTNKILIMFPPVSSQINANGVNNAYNIAAGATRTFHCYNSVLWLTDPETIA